jgi:tRNA U34 5-methylaminomethyl-2-thiouridine-forming methyltransferase MnmC
MKREILITGDGSPTVAIPEINVTYHSMHGAIQESMHVFIEAGLKPLLNRSARQPISIFEMGFGTGLNALLTLIQADQSQQEIYYETIEPDPVEADRVNRLNYHEQLQRPDLKNAFEQLHYCEWNKAIAITPYFTFKKMNGALTAYSADTKFNLIYFDAFAPTVQPELWTTEVFKKLNGIMETNGVLVTYSSKSIIRKAMTQAGFTVTKIPGPHGKREMVRAIVL